MQEFLLQTYTIILPIALGYIVWLLQQQKKDKNANERGTMLLLRVQLIEYHTKYMRLGEYHPMLIRTSRKCMKPIMI